MEMKYLYSVGVLMLAFLIGFSARGHFDTYQTANNNPYSQKEGKGFVSVINALPKEKSIRVLEDSELTIDETVEEPVLEIQTPENLVQYDPSKPIERLQALEKVRYSLPGSAFTRLVEDPFDNNGEISASMNALMELSADESDVLNQIFEETVLKIRDRESELFSKRASLNDDTILVIPAYSEQGRGIRKSLLDRVGAELGAKRRYLLEMMMLQKPTSFGNFGDHPTAFRNPRFETVNGWREIVTIDMGKLVDAGTEDERFEGVQKVFHLDAFKKRFGHIFEIKDMD